MAQLMPMPDPTQRQPDSPYERIAADLRAQVLAGHFSAGEPLPTVAELAAHYNVAVGTAQRAVASLRGEGLVQVSRGRRARVRGSA
jgi:DNA-binding GntR family transcriptional regulator